MQEINVGYYSDRLFKFRDISARSLIALIIQIPGIATEELGGSEPTALDIQKLKRMYNCPEAGSTTETPRRSPDEAFGDYYDKAYDDKSYDNRAYDEKSYDEKSYDEYLY